MYTPQLNRIEEKLDEILTLLKATQKVRTTAVNLCEDCNAPIEGSEVICEDCYNNRYR